MKCKYGMKTICLGMISPIMSIANAVCPLCGNDHKGRCDLADKIFYLQVSPQVISRLGNTPLEQNVNFLNCGSSVISESTANEAFKEFQCLCLELGYDLYQEKSGMLVLKEGIQESHLSLLSHRDKKKNLFTSLRNSLSPTELIQVLWPAMIRGAYPAGFCTRAWSESNGFEINRGCWDMDPTVPADFYKDILSKKIPLHRLKPVDQKFENIRIELKELADKINYYVGHGGRFEVTPEGVIFE